MSKTAQSKLSCKLCDYTTDRMYNYKRHMKVVHKMADIHEIANQQDVIIDQQDVIIDQQNVILDKQNVIIDQQNVITDKLMELFSCDRCHKCLSSKQALQRHLESCKGPRNALACDHCGAMFANRHNKSRHMKKCSNTVSSLPLPTTTNNQTAHTINNIGTQNNTTNTTNIINNNQVVLLQFPSKEYDPEFEFMRDHIPLSDLKRIWDSKPSRAFLRYSMAILDRKENQIVKKADTKTNHCEIRTEDGWEVALDKDVMPEIVYQMSVSAKDAWEECKNNKVNLKNTTWGAIDKHLDKINTEDEEVYNDTEQRLRLHIVKATKDAK